MKRKAKNSILKKDESEKNKISKEEKKKNEEEKKSEEKDKKEEDFFDLGQNKKEVEFIPIWEIAKSKKKSSSLEENSFSSGRNSLDSFIEAAVLEEKKDKQEKNLYSQKEENKNYFQRNNVQTIEVSRNRADFIEVKDIRQLRMLPLGNERSLELIRMPQAEQYLSEESYKNYEVERVKVDDLNRKTKKFREIDVKYEVD